MASRRNSEALISSGQIEPLIIVGIYNAGAERVNEYTAANLVGCRNERRARRERSASDCRWRATVTRNIDSQELEVGKRFEVCRGRRRRAQRKGLGSTRWPNTSIPVSREDVR